MATKVFCILSLVFALNQINAVPTISPAKDELNLTSQPKLLNGDKNEHGESTETFTRVTNDKTNIDRPLFKRSTVPESTFTGVPCNTGDKVIIELFSVSFNCGNEAPKELFTESHSFGDKIRRNLFTEDIASENKVIRELAVESPYVGDKVLLELFFTVRRFS